MQSFSSSRLALCRLLCLISAGCLGLATTGLGSPGSAPAGFQWQKGDTVTYSVSLADSQDLGVSGNINGGAGLSTLGETLSLKTFDSHSAPANTHYCVTSSAFNVSLTAESSATLFNFTGASDDFSGILSLSNFSIGLNGTAGPSTDSFVRSTTPLAIGAFDLSLFSDQAKADSNLSINLSDTGIAPSDGADMAFNFSGTMAAFFTSASGSTAGDQFYGAPSIASYNASIATVYDVYNLVAVPEPSSGFLVISGLLFAVLSRRRTS